MGPVNSLFVHNMSGVPTCTTYTYTRSNRFGAVETRHTTLSTHGIKSSISFSDGHGHVDFLQYRGAIADNSADYYTGGPQDKFDEGDYSHLYGPSVCKCTDSCPCVQRAEGLQQLTLKGDLHPVGDRRSQPCSPYGAAEEEFGINV